MSNIAYYTTALKQYLEPILPGYVEFYGNPKRLSLLYGLQIKHFNKNNADILNVGCGAFAIEMLLPLDKHHITSFDYMEQYGVLYTYFRNDGHLQNTSFFTADAQKAKFAENSFDLIIFNDIFYENALSVADLLAKYAAFLRPNGMMVFDIINTRTYWIWKCLGKEVGHKRYRCSEIAQIISQLNFGCLECQPALGSKGPLDSLFRRILWHVFGLSNNFTYLIQKGD
ncbi:MAG: class I SAM-dependent methyltransferase [Methylococcaceae bacterium]|nr:class I SAM-dependent methyltransferase [Methylococcaceae bacterium]